MTPNRTRVWKPSSSKASPPINRLMVNPIPASSASPKYCFHSTFVGREQNFKVIPMYVNNITPIGLPKSNPNATPSVTGSTKKSKFSPLRDTPALASAKRGKIKNATHICNPCSKRYKGSCSVRVVMFTSPVFTSVALLFRSASTSSTYSLSSMEPRKTPVLSPVSINVTDSDIRSLTTGSPFPLAGINIATITPASVA